MRTRATSTTSALLAACGLALALLPAPALAQNALGDGGALDRNLQRGSGGRNTRVRDIAGEIRYQNAIVTGNAPGGLSFRGNVGYTAPEDFRERLGSNDLFPFLRETALPAAAATASRPTASILPYQSAIPGFAPGLAGAGTRPLYVERAGAGAFGAEISTLTSTSSLLTQRALRPVVVGSGRTLDGRDVALAASPLLGLRTLEVPAAAPSPTGATGAAPTPIGAEHPGPSDVPIDPILSEMRALPAITPDTSGLADPTGARLQRQVWTFSGLEPIARGARQPLIPRATDALDLSAPDTLVTTQQRSDAYREVMDRLRLELAADRQQQTEQQPTEPPGERPAGAAAIQADLEARLNELRRRLTGEGDSVPLMPPQEPAAQPATPSGDQQQLPTPGGPPDTSLPTGAQQQPTRRGGAILPPPRVPRPGAEPPRELTPEERERRRERMARAGIRDPMAAALDPRTVEALKRSRTTVRDLRTPSVADNLVYAENMAAGQAFLAEGRYFDAEERFVRAAAAIPGDAMAAVGRIHAQIGAGLYMSASMNLRTLLSLRPELVATRYASELLPSAQRWAEIEGQLRSRAGGEDPGAARAASLLLAYLGYQMSDSDSVRDGLQALRDTAELDVPSEAAFVELLTQVWSEPGAPLPPPPEERGGADAPIDANK